MVLHANILVNVNSTYSHHIQKWYLRLIYQMLQHLGDHFGSEFFGHGETDVDGYIPKFG
jgi:hypothetical protein